MILIGAMEQIKGSKFCLLEFFEDKPVPTIRLGLSEWIEDLPLDEVRVNPNAFVGRHVLVRWPDPDKEDQDISTWSRHHAKIMLFGGLHHISRVLLVHRYRFQTISQ